MSGIVILTAIDAELDAARAPTDVTLTFTGVGKVNAAHAATLAILEHRPKLVVNYGTAGKIASNLRGLCEVAHVIQRDMMAMPLAPRGRTPFGAEFDRLSSGRQGVTCGTGDSFVTATDPWLIENTVDLVDMELFAIAHVCVHHGVPWRALKFITDDANDFAAEHWTANVADGQTLFWEAMKSLQLSR